jgi:hypothetical protein
MLNICDQCGSVVSRKLLRCGGGISVFHHECANGHKRHKTTGKGEQPATDSYHLKSFVIIEACDCSQ